MAIEIVDFPIENGGSFQFATLVITRGSRPGIQWPNLAIHSNERGSFSGQLQVHAGGALQEAAGHCHCHCFAGHHRLCFTENVRQVSAARKMLEELL